MIFVYCYIGYCYIIVIIDKGHIANNRVTVIMRKEILKVKTTETFEKLKGSNNQTKVEFIDGLVFSRKVSNKCPSIIFAVNRTKLRKVLQVHEFLQTLSQQICVDLFNYSKT